MPFDGLEYTREALAKELYLIELHAKDGSAFNAHCSCIQEKHLLGIIGLAEEGITLSKDEKERQFYTDLAQVARELRNEIMQEHFEMPTNPICNEIKKRKAALPDMPDLPNMPNLPDMPDLEGNEHSIRECVKECMVDGHTKKECEASCKS